MRTTVTLDADVERMLKKAMHRRRRSFKETLNIALRAGLAGNIKDVPSVPFKVLATPMGLKAGIDPTSLNKTIDDLEIESRTSNRAKQ